MRIRYSKNHRGKLIKQAEIYSREDHEIDSSLVDADAVKVCRRLESHGYEAYIVGGAVRDLMVGKTPKDFDIVTDAYPSQIKKVFRNSRIIGRRFRLVHLYFANNKILEVATFRSSEAGNHNNVYGTIEEDVLRRDFTINALFYSPGKQEILDFVGGVKDIRRKVLQSVIPLNKTFHEDPVRMLRAVKYSTGTGLRIPFFLSNAIKRNASKLESCSISRLTEELFKILQSGRSRDIFEVSLKMGIFAPLLPHIYKKMKKNREYRKTFFKDMEKLDQRIVEEGEIRRSRMLRFLLMSYLDDESVFLKGMDTRFKEVVIQCKEILNPLIAPNAEVEDAVKQMFRKKRIRSQKRRSNRSRRRKGKTANLQDA